MSEQKENIAVIGAGLAGCLSAIFLAKAGYEVLLIEEKTEIMSVTSKIPVHLHSGGLYIKSKENGELDMDDAYHCLHDSINFIKAMSFAVVPRPTAFAVMSIGNNMLPNGKTQLLDEATDLYRADLLKNLKIKKGTIELTVFMEQEKQINDEDIPKNKIGEYQEKVLKTQERKWEIMKEGFESLQKKYDGMVQEDSGNKVLGEPSNFFVACEQKKFKLHRRTAIDTPKEEKIQEDPPLANKEGWLLQLASVTDPETIAGVILSSELGLNMIRAKAGIQIELERLKQDGVISIVLGKKVEKINISELNSHFELKISDRESTIPVSQVVNATGHRGKDFDMQMGHQLDWSIDVKGVGIIELTDDTFEHVPEVYFTQAKGMCHFGRLNSKVAGVNFATPYVEATYLKDGKQVIEKDAPVILKQNLQQFLDTPIHDKSSLDRTKACITGCARFMPMIENSCKPTAYLPGSLAIIGSNLDARGSREVYISENGYHAVNIIKGGGAISAAMALVQKVENHSKEKSFSNKNDFPRGSHSILDSKFMLKLEEKELNENANKEANKSNLENAGIKYGKKK